MKIALRTDEHWSTYSSILRKRGEKYSIRLERLIASMNWFENLAVATGCELEYGLGDFCDKDTCTAEELTALNEVHWNNIPKKVLVGNHEMATKDLSLSTVHTLALKDTVEVIDKPYSELIGGVEFCYLPYILEADRKHISEYFAPSTYKRIILSHNDIAGVNMGQFVSQVGFDIEDIQNNCDLFLNGHLHNGYKVADKIINIGNLCGQNFSEDASKYDHCAFILDTDTLKIDVYENPEAINFYKIDWTSGVKPLNIKNNSVLTVKVKQDDYEEAKKLLSNNTCILESRIITERNTLQVDIEDDFTTVDHIARFRTFITDKLGNTDIVAEELQEITR